MELITGMHQVQHAIRQPIWHPGLSDAVAQLKAAFAVHVEETEGPGGLYAGVLGDAPRLAAHVEGLVGDHETVWSALDDLETRLNDRHTLDTVRSDAARLVREMWEHRQRGADVLYEAYDTDLGGET